MDELKKLNLGCGQYKKEGFVNIDIEASRNPEIVHDLNILPYPFADNTFDHIEADHILEHLEKTFVVMKELHRILKPGGTLEIRVPHFSRGLTHSDHRRGFDVSFPYYFRPSFTGGYTGFEFQTVSVTYTWFAQEYLKKTVLSPPAFYIAKTFGMVVDFFANIMPFLCSRLWCYWVGGFEQIEFKFVCKK